MIIGVAGPYSADTEEQRRQNFDRLNQTAGRLLEMGHIPLIGINAALPVMKHAEVDNPYEGIMQISMAVINACEALLIIAESPGANREHDLILKKGLPVYYSIAEVPATLNK